MMYDVSWKKEKRATFFLNLVFIMRAVDTSPPLCMMADGRWKMADGRRLREEGIRLREDGRCYFHVHIVFIKKLSSLHQRQKSGVTTQCCVAP